MTVMTANGEARTNEEATVYVKQLDLFVTVMLLQETPAVLSLGNSAKNMGIGIIGKAVRIHISSKTARELIAIYSTMYHLWFLGNKWIKRNPRRNRVNRCVLRSRSGCKNSEKIWWMMKFSSSHEVSLEPIFKRREDLGKHSVYTHFP